MSKPVYTVARDNDGWGVMDAKGIFVNEEPFSTRREAAAFSDELYQAHAEERANERYWSQTIFGE